MDSKKSNKITEIVRLQQMIKKWKKMSVSKNGTSTSTNTNNNSSSKGMKFLKRTLSFTDPTTLSCDIPKGHLAVCVGEEMRRFIIPTHYLGHRAFASLLREAEEEFGFQNEGVLRIPCEVGVFESTLKLVENNKDGVYYCSSQADFGHSHYSPNPIYQ